MRARATTLTLRRSSPILALVSVNQPQENPIPVEKGIGMTPADNLEARPDPSQAALVSFGPAGPKLLNTIVDILNSNLDLDALLRMILVGLTAGEGLRFNRGFLLLLDEHGHPHEGSLAIGPASAEEAERIWRQLDTQGQSIEDLMMRCLREGIDQSPTLTSILRRLERLVCGADNVLVRSLHDGVLLLHPGDTRQGAEAVARALGVSSFAAAPLVARGLPLGILLADNAITGAPITSSDTEVLRLFASHAAAAIDRARLHTHLGRERLALQAAQKHLDETRRRVLQLQRLSVIGEMAARLAHEIRNPLVAIGGFARRCASVTDAADPRRRYLDTIVGEVNRLEEILRSVLEYARPIQLRLRRGSISDVVAESVEQIRAEAEEAGIRIDLRLDDDLPPGNFDADLLKEALVNLLRNGIQAMPEGGTLSAGTASDHGFLEAWITDTGPGIPEAALEEIFTPFYTTKTSGSGLGLPIAAQILREHHGFIRAESGSAGGATFRLRVPIETSEAR